MLRLKDLPLCHRFTITHGRGSNLTVWSLCVVHCSVFLLIVEGRIRIVAESELTGTGDNRENVMRA